MDGPETFDVLRVLRSHQCSILNGQKETFTVELRP